jgi:hypothetical protein
LSKLDRMLRKINPYYRIFRRAATFLRNHDDVSHLSLTPDVC